MKNYIIVGIGSAIGGMVRFFLSNFVYKFLSPVFPYGTLVVNALGSFLIGIFLFYLDANELISSEMRIFLTVGFCGGLTTFSTFSYETFSLIQNSEYLFTTLNIVLNLLFSFTGILLAFIISHKILRGF
ncbi:MAG: fluoride efflux transporter CrcB [Ignavibacteria bacterium]|jgi:CrcB protein|nr:fluoride efflux transporter CrcB [Ignavibacteria bacterium]MDH7528117.1 fluoride efflux transporter CrcB [Ignavibacteria bacterium]